MYRAILYVLLSTLWRTNYCYFYIRYIYSNCIIEASLLHTNTDNYSCFGLVSILSRSSWSGHFELKNVQITNITDNTFVNQLMLRRTWAICGIYQRNDNFTIHSSDIWYIYTCRALFIPVYMQCRLIFWKGIQFLTCMNVHAKIHIIHWQLTRWTD
jgi:hypothetical protein